MIETARQRRAQQVEAKYAADLRRLRQAKEDELADLNKRHKLLKNTHRMEVIRIKEEFALRRLNLKTQIEHLRDQRANLRHALSVDADTSGLGNLSDLTMQINNLHVELIGLERKMALAMNDADGRFDQREKELAEERRAINKHYINEAERLHEAYLQHVEQNRQERESEEGGSAV